MCRSDPYGFRSTPEEIRRYLADKTLFNKPNKIYLASDGTAFSVPDGKKITMRTRWRIRQDSLHCVDESPAGGTEICIRFQLKNSVLSTRTFIEIDGTELNWWVLDQL